MQVFYVNIGGGEPTLRPDFSELVEYAVNRQVGVKFSTNGTTMTPARARRYAAMDYLDIQISLDGASPATNDPYAGRGPSTRRCGRWNACQRPGFGSFKVSVVVTRHNAGELERDAPARGTLRRRAAGHEAAAFGPGAASWHELRPTAEQLAQGARDSSSRTRRC